MPLFDRSTITPPDHVPTSHVSVLDQAVFADPFDVVTIPVARLGQPLCRPPDADQDVIMRARDELVSRA